VDDGSRDDTARIVAAAASRDFGVVLQREPHRGKGGAVRHGLLAARGELRFMCDADLSMTVRDITRFLAIVPDRADIAIAGNRGTAMCSAASSTASFVLRSSWIWTTRSAASRCSPPAPSRRFSRS
jgi:glycosyltransferase involved in cell wall biosynthesis